MSTPAISARGITMRFGDAEVLSGVDVDIRQGSIHALIGENGAGKSTLGKVVGGYHQATAGALTVFGEPAGRWDPPAALDRGVAMMHQELQLVPHLTVAQNVFMGIEENRWGLLRRNEADRLDALMAQSGLHLDPHAVTESLPIADQQKIEILRALAREARVIVMDEPTSSLSKDEIDNLHRIMIKLREEGRSVIYVTHFLDHVLEVCDRVTVLRDGKLVKSGDIADETKQGLVSAMLGEHKSETLYPAKRPSTSDRVVLRVRGLRGKDVSVDALDIREGEILGLIGLVGSGRSEIARAIVGADPAVGEITLDGVPVPHSVRGAAEAGMVLVPEDRRAQGLVMTMPVRANISLPRLAAYSRAGVVGTRRERETARAFIERFGIRPAMIDGNVSHYSGGNQQKVLLAKWLDGDPKLVILDEPSRGVDVGARETIHATIADLAAAGTAILLISSEIEEVLGLAHRACIVDRGRIVQDIDPGAVGEAEVLAALFRHQSLEDATS
jgi:ribose transport system ATP-binding protein